MLSRKSPGASPQELVPLRSGRKESVVIHEFTPPKKIACGNCHTLFINATSVQQEDADEPAIMQTRVYGWGGNRHNVLGMKKETGADSPGAGPDVYEMSHGDVGTAPWKTEVPEPTKEVFNAQDPMRGVLDRKDEARRQKSDPKFALGDRATGKQPLSNERGRDFMDFFEVSCGNNHSMILEKQRKEDGDLLYKSRLWSFGLKAHGRLGRGRPAHFQKQGDEDADDSDVESDCDFPEEVMENFASWLTGFGDMHVTPVVQRVCCGGDHTLAIVNMMGSGGDRMVCQGRVFAWGLGSYGALGTRQKVDAWVPREVWFPTEEMEDSSRCITIQQVACGSKHSMALSHEGKVYTWGHGGNGCLGLGRKDARLGSSFSAEFEPKNVSKLAETKITYIAAGESHSGAVDQLGGLHTWGAGSFGRCGQGMLLDVIYPARVESLLGIATHQIAFGMMHSMAVTVPGQLYAWGKGPATGLDRGDNEVFQIPTQVFLPEKTNIPVFQVATGPMHSVVLLQDGTLFVFGSGSLHRMPKIPGNAAEMRRDVACPKKLEGPFTGWKQSDFDDQRAAGARKGKHSEKPDRDKHDRMPAQISAGGSNSATVLLNGDLWIWGNTVLSKKVEPAPAPHSEDSPKGDSEQVDANDQNIWLPQQLKQGLRNFRVRMIAIGQEHALALTDGKQLFAWGEGVNGQLGTGHLGHTDTPQHVQNMADVTCIAAGEEHSACIIEGGESYTWGNAGGGRLGLGATMNEGTQMLPEQVCIKAKGTKDLRLRAVTCGSQHTCFISDDDRVLACGVGWFGRLGQGTQDYSYSPEFIENSQSGNLLAHEVKCATYHTCVVDKSKGLWLMGRDTSCCQPAGQHLLSPVKFEPFENPRRYIFAIACSDSHTLAITSQRPDTRHGTELWAWGKNSRGQLGISEAEAPYIDLPWQLRIPGEGKEWHKFSKVATSSWHSLVVVEGKGQNSNHFDVYSWGFSGSGRLGQKVVGATEAETKQAESEALAKAGHPLVRPPRKVDVRWKPPVMVESQKRESTELDGDGPTAKKFDELLQLPCKDWLDVQIRLHAEDPDNKKGRLLDQSKRVGTTYTDFMNDILLLWDKPPPEPYKLTEWHLRQKQREVESQYIRTLEVLSLTNSVHAPRIESLVKTEDEVKQKLHLFEELFWILQQQPLYLTNLSCHVSGKKRDERECLIFHRIVSRLFNNFREARTRNLFKALVRAMIETEMAKVSEAAELFDPIKSRVAPLFTQMCTNPYYLESIAKSIVDPEEKLGLMHIIVKYTLTKDSRNVRNKRYWLGGIFSTNHQEYKDREVYYRKKNGMEARSTDEDGKGRQYFKDELKDFAKLLNGIGGNSVPYDKEVANEDDMTPEELRKRFDGVYLLDLHGWKRMRKERLYCKEANRTDAMEDELRHRVMAALHGPDWEKELEQTLCLDVPFIKDFISHFVKNTLGGKEEQATDFQKEQAKDFQMLLVHAYQNLVKQKFVIQFKSTEGENAWQPELLAPIAAIVIANIIGGVLFAIHNKEGPFACMRMKIEKYVQDEEDRLLAGKDAEDKARLKDRNLVERVWWNVEHLALFFERCVHKNVYDFQKKGEAQTAATQEEAAAKDAATELKNHTCKALMAILQDRVGEGGYSKDKTETQLTVDLYTSHYSMAKHYISVSTSDMLHLTNILHHYMEPDARHLGKPPIRTDKPENDRVCKLIQLILPKETGKDGKEYVRSKARTVPWSAGYISIAQNAGEMHNFTMPARFLEFKRDGLEEPTFCVVTQAPIPRSLAKEEQKERRGVRVVKPLRDDRGPEYDIPGIGTKAFPYEEILLLFDTLSGSSKGEQRQDHIKYSSRIKGNSFSSLRDSFEDIQNTISKEMEENTTGPTAGQNAELLQRLENGKIFVGKIAESMEEKDLREYMERELRKRNEYRAYLTSLREGSRTIQDAQKAYRKELKDTYNKLSVLNTISEQCEMPEEISGAMQIQQERPKFADAKKFKARKVSAHPTPARLVLDELIRISGDSGKVNTENLKEMVGFPARTFTKSQLEKKGVLVQVNDMVPNHVRKDMKFTFQFDNEAYLVRAFVRTTLLREFVISRQDIELLTAGRKNAIMSYGDAGETAGPFIWVHCFRLRRLLAFIMAEGGL